MARRGRRKKAGLMREDAARDAMRAFGFEEGVIKVCIKELLELYGEGGWFLIEEFSYSVLLNKCLEKQGEQDNNVAEEEEETAEEQNVEMAQGEQDNNVAEEEEEMDEELNVEMAQEEQEQAAEEEEEQHVDSNSSTALAGCGAGQTDALSIASETEIMDTSPSAFPSGEVEDYASPVAFQSSDYAHHYTGGAKNCGWLSDEEETDPDGDSDDEMIRLTPEPLCEELKELLREVHGEEKKRKRSTRWDT